MARGITFTLTAIEIHDTVMYNPGGIVSRWCRVTAQELREAARGYCPPGHSKSRTGHNLIATGALLESIEGYAYRAGARRINMILSAGTDHAMYVLGGTGHGGQRYIYSTLGWANKSVIDSWYRTGEQRVGPFEGGNLTMKLPPGPGGHFPFQYRVRGQIANPFLQDGYNLVARRHGALPTKRFSRLGTPR